MDIAITTTWDGDGVNHDPVTFKLEEDSNGLQCSINAPYFGDPPPSGPVSKPTWLLWEYEVVELFFLNSKTGEYLELEFGPHGHYLGLLFKKCREVWRKDLTLSYTSHIEGDAWRGYVTIPWDFFPLGTDKFNAYAIHGQESSRCYEALNPAPKNALSQPDFHVLKYFKDVAMKELFPNGSSQMGKAFLED